MTSRSRFVSRLVISLTCLTPLTYGANIVVNGNFSGPIVVTNVDGVNDNLPFGWGDSGPAPGNSKLNVVAAGSLPGSPLDPLGSSFYLAFQSPDLFSQDCLFQVFNTVAGQAYTLSFWLALTQPSSHFQMTPDWDVGTANRQILSTSGYDQFSASDNNFDNPITVPTAAMGFQQFSYHLIASKDGTFTYFHGVDSGGGAVLLADVSLTADQGVPEPRALSLVGFGLVLLGLTRLTRKTA